MAADKDQDLRADPRDRSDLQPRRGGGRWLLALAVLGIAGVAAWLWWPPKEPDIVQAPTPATAAAAAASAAQPAVKYPIEVEEGAQALAAPEFGPAIAELLGRSAFTRFIHADDMPRRFVATVDNLGREYAPPALWPVVSTPGRFVVADGADGQEIAAVNAARYRPFVLFAQSVDAEQAVRLYRRMYPLLQEAYQQLGFGGRYFNDRVVEVVDLLLATPEPAQPLRVHLTEVKGPIASERPWVRYEFVDPRLEALPSGQKMLLRVGPEHRAVLKGKLRELRQHLVARPAAAPAAAR